MGRSSRSEIAAQSTGTTEPVQTKPEQPQQLKKIVHRCIAARDFEGQDALIEELESKGYAHYQTMNLGGGEILLRFRLSQAMINNI